MSNLNFRHCDKCSRSQVWCLKLSNGWDLCFACLLTEPDWLAKYKNFSQSLYQELEQLKEQVKNHSQVEQLKQDITKLKQEVSRYLSQIQALEKDLSSKTQLLQAEQSKVQSLQNTLIGFFGLF